MTHAEAIFRSWLRPPPEPVTVDRVIREVATYYGITSSQIRGHRRHRSLVWPRAVAMYLARTHSRRSFPELARDFGDRHHTSVMTAVDKVRERIAQRGGALAEDVGMLESRLGVVL